MKFVALGLALLGGLALSAPAPGQTHDPDPAHASHTSHAPQTALIPVPAQRWKPDAPLREGMRRARTAITQMHHAEEKSMSGTQIAEQAGAVESAVTYMFAHCSLAEEPDAALHSILLPLLHSAHTLKDDPDNDKAMADMQATLARYPQYFNDPGW